MHALALRLGAGRRAAPAPHAPPPSARRRRPAPQETNEKINEFLNAPSADHQLAILKEILSTSTPEDDVIQFLAAVYLEADHKHPVKCYLARCVTKNPSLQDPFELHLLTELRKQIMTIPSQNTRKELSETVSAIISCGENFQTGVNVLKKCENDLILYLGRALHCNVDILRKDSSLSPTDTNEVFTLTHNVLRALLGAFQKVNDGSKETILLSFTSIYASIDELMKDKDVPMDTKSLCGILIVTMLRLEHGQDYWAEHLCSLKGMHCADSDSAINKICMYTAMVTVVPLAELQQTLVEGQVALVMLISEVLHISERFSVEPLVALCIARSLLSLTKALQRSTLTSEAVDSAVNVLIFVWAHVEHFMDSVRHLTTQVLTNVLRYFAKLEKAGLPQCLDIFLEDLSCLPRNRKAYYIGLSALASVVGAGIVLEQIPGLIPKLISALSNQAVQSSVASSIEILLQKHIEESNTRVIYDSWVCPILDCIYESAESGFVDTTTLTILEGIIAKAIKWDDKIMSFILPKARAMCTDITVGDGDLKCVLVCLNLARKMGALDKMVAASDDTKWRSVLSRDVIELAMVNSSEEIRILALSLIVETSKSTEPFTAMDFDLLLLFLKYNANTQAPNVRHLTLSLIKKFMKRLNDSFRIVCKLDKAPDSTPQAPVYVQFLDRLRAQCFDSLLPGANYSRRAIALQVLAWCEQLEMEKYQSQWCEEYMEKLLIHVEDSYENNKVLAFQILTRCPAECFQRPYCVSLKLSDVLGQASSVKPPDCVSAAYKLQLIQTSRHLLPDRLFENLDPCVGTAESTTYSLIKLLWERLKIELKVAQESIMLAASQGPMYGIIFCVRHLLGNVDASKISSDPAWIQLISELISVSMLVTSSVAPIVNNSSPEGHLPMDCESDSPHLPGGGVMMGGVRVTAQMVLLCAWRSVKEVSLLLGEISGKLHIRGEGKESGSDGGTLTREDMLVMGEHFTTLLAETKHRGAFEQAYVGFTKLCARLWKCQNVELHSLPRSWLAGLMEAIVSGDRSGKLCATRRSAGVPFMIQALVTTELQVVGNPRCFHESMNTLLKLASFDPRTSEVVSVESRTHCLNILRAMFRHTALGEVVNTYVGIGLQTAIEGFDGTTWAERNSSTLLFSSLMVRIFGVQRSKDSDKLCIRNKMTGRTFFLRYPNLYEFMLSKLKEVNCSEGSHDLLRPSLYPVLLLLARLYPYSLEECTTNLRLVAFVPHVTECGGSCVLKTRQLAAKALVPLISQEKYISHINELLKILGNKTMKTNYCHGILLQLIRLMESKPENLKVDSSSYETLSRSLEATFWIMEQTLAAKPCYITGDEYMKVLNLFLWRFPAVVDEEFAIKIKAHLRLLFDRKISSIYYGRDVFLSNALSFYLILLLKFEQESVAKVVIENLANESYEVVLSVLNFILLLYNEMEGEIHCKFLKHLQTILIEDGKDVLVELKNDKDFIGHLFEIVESKKYLECLQKSLAILSFQNGTQARLVHSHCKELINPNYNYLVNSDFKDVSREAIIGKLIEKIQNEHENISHIFMISLNNYISNIDAIDEKLWIEIVKVIYESCSSENSEAKRRNVVSFLEDHIVKLMKLDLRNLDKSENFALHASLWATLVTLLEDDEQLLRQRASDLVVKLARELTGTHTELNHIVPSKASEILLDTVEAYYDCEVTVGVLLVVALLDFNCEVGIGDDLTDERAKGELIDVSNFFSYISEEIGLPRFSFIGLPRKCRVFDHNEKYNIFLEESSWTRGSAARIKKIIKKEEQSTADCINNIIKHINYSGALQKLCSDNLRDFVRVFYNNFKGDVNPKVKLCAIFLQ